MHFICYHGDRFRPEPRALEETMSKTDSDPMGVRLPGHWLFIVKPGVNSSHIDSEIKRDGTVWMDTTGEEHGYTCGQYIVTVCS